MIRSLSYYACCSAAPTPGGRQQPRPRRTQRRVTHNEKRYHSGTPLSTPAYCFCTELTSHWNIWKHSVLTFNERTTWRRRQHANRWSPLSSLCVFFRWFMAVSVNDATELSEVNIRNMRIGNECEIKQTGWMCHVFRHSCLAFGWLISVSWLGSQYFPDWNS